MKKWLLFLALCLCHVGFGSPIQDHTLDREALSQLTSTLGIPPEADLIAETQKQWLRKPNQERWEVTELAPEQRAFVLNWATEQGLFSAWKPALSTYDKALIFGATTPRMQTRLEQLKQLWNEGIRFQEIVWLTGERPLDPQVDGLTDRVKNESEAAHIVWEEADLPEEMRKLPVVFVEVPMKEGGKRPNTEDTIVAWLKVALEPCQVLFVSDQPFCGYQFAIVKATLPEAFQYDLAGRGVDPTKHPRAAAIVLDSIARWLYQESLARQKSL